MTKATYAGRLAREDGVAATHSLAVCSAMATSSDGRANLSVRMTVSSEGRPARRSQTGSGDDQGHNSSIASSLYLEASGAPTEADQVDDELELSASSAAISTSSSSSFKYGAMSISFSGSTPSFGSYTLRIRDIECSKRNQSANFLFRYAIRFSFSPAF